MPIGIVNSIWICPTAGAEMVSIPSASVVIEKGIEGDRYYNQLGSFSRWPGDGRHLTLIEQEVIDAVRDQHGIDLTRGQSRRNVVTSGVRLAELNGRVFRIGTTLLRGTRECAPCKYLERLVPGSFDALIRRGGLRANVMESGVIAAGDAIELRST
jgi:MOSC domain-containing protein YiiM